MKWGGNAVVFQGLSPLFLASLWSIGSFVSNKRKKV